jgi:hypothetical protein
MSPKNITTDHSFTFNNTSSIYSFIDETKPFACVKSAPEISPKNTDRTGSENMALNANMKLNTCNSALMTSQNAKTKPKQTINVVTDKLKDKKGLLTSVNRKLHH